MEHQQQITESYNRFIQIITERDLSSYQVSLDTQISNPVFSAWKSGERMPKLSNIQKISEYLNINPEYLLCTTDTVQEQKSLEKELEFYNAMIKMIRRELPQCSCRPYYFREYEVDCYDKEYNFIENGKRYCFDEEDMVRIYKLTKRYVLDMVRLTRRSLKSEKEIQLKREKEIYDYLNEEGHHEEYYKNPALRLLEEGEDIKYI